MTRRQFFELAAAAGLLGSRSSDGAAQGAPYPVQFRKPGPHEALYRFALPGEDEFAGEKQAAEVAAHLRRLVETRALPLAEGFAGLSPMPARYRTAGEGVQIAEYDSRDSDFGRGLEGWIESLKEIRSSRFYVLAEEQVRYEIASTREGTLHYRVGHWQMSWKDGRLARFRPLNETLVSVTRPLFEDITGLVFGGVASFQEQLRRGVPYWRARLDSACGIDVYGNNGIAVGDIDNDGWDEIYVCQPGGLPNRLYKRGSGGAMADITERAGIGVLDDTACVLFLDLRNIGWQDLLVLTTTGPLLFLNQRDGTFRLQPNSFRSRSVPQGTFTGMAAADYDRNGKLDLYLCTYVYFQSEDQYRYPVPYHDAQNGPPNFLFRNRLTAEGGGYFEDVTAEAGLDHNNNRFSFAPAWCDYDGDGWPDLYVANDFGRNNLYKNEGGRFRDVAAEAGVEDIGPGMSAAWFDYDGDGALDLYVSNMWTASGQRVVRDPAFAPASNAALKEAYHRHTKGNSLYRNKGDGSFEEVGASEGVEFGRWAWSSDGIDFDNDGTPEIYVAAGMLTDTSEADLMSFFWRQVVARSPVTRKAAPEYENGWNALNQLIREDWSWNGREPNVFLVRRGGRYYDFSGVSGVDVAEDTRAFAVTDLDGDGNLDLLLKSRLGPQVRAFRNQSGVARNCLALDLHGAKSNRDAIGAIVEVTHPGGRVVRALNAGSGYLSQHTKRLHFGLGESKSATRVKVRWPSGVEQQFHGLEAGYRYEIVEGSAQTKRVPFLKQPAQVPVPAPPTGDNTCAFEEAWMVQPLPLPEVHQGPGFLLLVAGEPPAVPIEIPIETIDLNREPKDRAAAFALFRRYLFDYRAGLTLPFLVLLDERGLAAKVYPSLPPASKLRQDLEALKSPDRLRLALPFPGFYASTPTRNYFRLGAAFFWAGYPEQALQYLGQVLEENPANFKAQLATGQIHLGAGRLEAAGAHLQKALELNSESPEVWNNLGILDTNRGDYRGALVKFERALAIRPESAYALANAAQAQARLGDLPGAEKRFRLALQLDPNDAETANQLGLMLAKTGRATEARDLFQRAITLRGDHAAAINNLGVLYMQMQKPDDALAAFLYGVKEAPDDETLCLNLARVYSGRGETEKAREVLLEFLDRKPGSELARKALEQLGAR